jgi:roadblock/LC7 domain-containing protein
MPTDFVRVTVTTETTALTRAGFGLGLIFDPTANFDYTLVENTADIPAEASEMVENMVAQAFSQVPAPRQIAVYGVDITEPVSTITDELNSLILEHNDWYFLLLASRTQAEIEEAAGWGTANGKLPIFQADITEEVATIVAMAEAISNEVLLYAHDGGVAEADPYIDASIFGRIAPTDPGSINWAIKQLNGVPKTTYTKTELNTLDEANVNSYMEYMGVNVTTNGICTNGTYADIVRSRDWLKSRIEENVFFVLLNNDKVPYTDIGISQIVGALRKSLRVAVSQGVIATDENNNPMFTIDAPTRAETTPNDRANRILPDINWTATIAGAINEVEINGVLEV